jgi:parallel beta-helix repeat protein
MNLKRCRTVLPLISFIVAVPRMSLAATYYVGPSGDANVPGTSREAPTTPVAAAAKVSPGDVVIYLDGVYKEFVLLSRAGTAEAPITFRADDGAVPIIRGNGIGENQGAINAAPEGDVGHYIFEGLWFEEWGSGGIELDWANTKCHDITIRYCVADRNGRNGFSPYNSNNVTLEYNIASRNGYRDDSWSSNFNLFGVRGKVYVRGNVAFHGIDTSANKSDGNGFIIDLSLANADATFENNIAFANGGACIAVTDSGNTKLIGNTCYQNVQDAASNVQELNFVNTCRGKIDDTIIDVQGKPWTFSNLVARNNAVIYRSGKKDFATITSCGGGTTFVNENNYTSGTAEIYENPAAADFRPKAGSALVDKVAHGTTFASDIGFDPKCIKVETDESKKTGNGVKRAWWTHAPDIDYVKRIGGIKNCFSPRTRPQGSNQEIGAYELSTSGCTTAASCDDSNACTRDTCGTDGKCVNTPITGCGTGSGGAAGAGGTPAGGAGGTTPTGGTGPLGGTAGATAGGGVGGTASSGAGGLIAGGNAGSAGAVTTAGAGSANGGSLGAGGTQAAGGSASAGQPQTSGGNLAGGAGGAPAGNSGGTSPGSGATNSAGSPTSSDSGCSCTVPTSRSRESTGLGMLALAGLGLVAAKRRKGRQNGQS